MLSSLHWPPHTGDQCVQGGVNIFNEPLLIKDYFWFLLYFFQCITQDRQMWTLLPCLMYYYFEGTLTQWLDPWILTKRSRSSERRVDNFILKVLLFKRYKCLMFIQGAYIKSSFVRNIVYIIISNNPLLAFFYHPVPWPCLHQPVTGGWGLASRKYPGQTNAWYMVAR